MRPGIAPLQKKTLFLIGMKCDIIIAIADQRDCLKNRVSRKEKSGSVLAIRDFLMAIFDKGDSFKRRGPRYLAYAIAERDAARNSKEYTARDGRDSV